MPLSCWHATNVATGASYRPRIELKTTAPQIAASASFPTIPSATASGFGSLPNGTEASRRCFFHPNTEAAMSISAGCDKRKADRAVGRALKMLERCLRVEGAALVSPGAVRDYLRLRLARGE